MRRRAATIAAVLIAILFGVVSAASAESLTLVLGAKAEVGEPYPIVAEGVLNDASRLYVYVDPGGANCGADQEEEASHASGPILLSSLTGDDVGPGPFTSAYNYTPPEPNGYSVCAYVVSSPPTPIPLIARGGFGAPGGPAQAPYLYDPPLQEEMKRLALEQQQLEEREQARRQREREELEAIPASALVHPEQTTAPERVTPAPVPHCKAPALKGLSLDVARNSLRRAHCRLGRVVRPQHSRGRLVVTRQGKRRGTVLSAGAPVAVVLGPSGSARRQ